MDAENVTLSALKAAPPSMDSVPTTATLSSFDTSVAPVDSELAESHVAHDTTDKEGEEEEEEDSEELVAWKQVHATLVQAVLKAQRAVQAQKAQRRFWLEEVCGNLTDNGKLVTGSVWKRPSPQASGTVGASSTSAARKNNNGGGKGGSPPSNSLKRKQKDASSTTTSPGEKSSTKKSRKKKHGESSEQDATAQDGADDSTSPTPPPKKRVKLSTKRSQEPSVRPPPQPIFPHPSVVFRTPAPMAPSQFHPSHHPQAAMMASQQQQQQWSNSAASAAAQNNSNLQLMAAVAFGQNTPANFFFPPPPPPPPHLAAPSAPAVAHHPNPPAYPQAPRNYTSLQDLETDANEDSEDERNHTF